MRHRWFGLVMGGTWDKNQHEIALSLLSVCGFRHDAINVPLSTFIYQMLTAFIRFQSHLLKVIQLHRIRNSRSSWICTAAMRTKLRKRDFSPVHTAFAPPSKINIVSIVTLVQRMCSVPFSKCGRQVWTKHLSLMVLKVTREISLMKPES